MHCRAQRISESAYRSHLQLHTLILQCIHYIWAWHQQEQPPVHRLAVSYSASVLMSVIIKILSSLGRVAYLSLAGQEAPAEGTPGHHSQTKEPFQDKVFFCLRNSHKSWRAYSLELGSNSLTFYFNISIYEKKDDILLSSWRYCEDISILLYCC